MVKKVQKKEVNKISYNAFKMWGSYVGAIILGLYTLAFHRIEETGLTTNTYTPLEAFLGKAQPFFGLRSSITNVVLAIIIGFLIGWGIHNIIRKLRSNN